MGTTMYCLIYPFIIRPWLFCLKPETAHSFALSLLHYIPSFCFAKPKAQPVKVMGLNFTHRIGLAAGLDKNGDHVQGLAKLGFSFIELGTVTPRPQLGNPKPRLFRLIRSQALINRLGFNNKGVDALIQNIRNIKYKGILGINIGKNKDTPLDKAADDYVYCLRKVYPYADYIVINISSPNTPELRQLQREDYFSGLLHILCEARVHLSQSQGRYVPLVIKISPDETKEQLQKMAAVMLQYPIDGITATNTTAQRNTVEHEIKAHEQGGLSGKPLAQSATECLKIMKEVVGDKIALIGVGGIDSGEKAREKLEAGASLIQIYTGLIYKGPGLIKDISQKLCLYTTMGEKHKARSCTKAC